MSIAFLDLFSGCPPHWLIKPLDEVAFFQEGPGILAKDFRASGIPLIRLSGLKSNYASLDGCNYLDSDMVNTKWNHFKLTTDDILISTSATIGRTSFVNKEVEGAIAYTGIIRFRPKTDRLDKKFLNYFLKSSFFIDQAESFASGSVISHFGPTHLKRMGIQIPSIEEQKAIASVLSSLDDKIDLLHRQNTTLERMAETLFRQWFVEEAQEDWEQHKLGDCVTISYGKNLPTKNLLEDGFPVFGANGQIGFYDRYTYDEPQVLVSCRGEASGKVNISLPKSYITNNSLVLERNKMLEISFEFLKYWALSYDFDLHVSGSAQPQITIEGLYDADFTLPSKDLIEKFTEMVKGLETKKLNNFFQIQTLEKLRDNLLPKLMSGEVRVHLQGASA